MKFKLEELTRPERLVYNLIQDHVNLEHVELMWLAQQVVKVLLCGPDPKEITNYAY